MARPGWAWLGKAGRSEARQGKAWFFGKEQGVPMNYRTTVKGVSSLLMHRFDESAEAAEATRKIHLKSEDPRDAAEKCAHRAPDGSLYLPGASFGRLLREAGGAHKQRGSRKSLKYVVPSAILVVQEIVTLHDDTGKPLTDFEVDSRPVVIPSTKGRIMRHRPRLNAWSATFDIDVSEDLIDASTVQQLLTEGGRALGVGDFRPEKGGPFGRFMVTNWSALEAVPITTKRGQRKAA